MNKRDKNKNRILKRILSITLALALIIAGLPPVVIPDELFEFAGLIRNVKAAQELDPEALAALTARYTATSYSFTSGGTQLSEYSQCFQDLNWAEDHADDILMLNPVDNKFIFDSNYNPIGAAGAAFSGTIVFNTSANDFAVDASGPIFNYVSDSVKLQRVNDHVNIPININRVADVGSTVSPLFAVHVVGSTLATPAEWKVTLNSASAHSYSGVIYELTDGAKINLTFNDESSHTPVLDPNGNIVSGSIIDNKESGKNYGILCGKISGNSVFQSKYTKTNDDVVTFIGTENAYTGGLIGEINGSSFELLGGSSSTKVDFQTAKDQVGFICGHAENNSTITSTIKLPKGYTFEGTIDGKVYAGGIAGYCKNTIVNYFSAADAIALSNCEVKNGTTTGGVFGYYECNDYDEDILIDRTYTLSDCTVEGAETTGVSGGIAGEYKPNYSHSVTIDLDNYTLGNTIELNTGAAAGGLFGKYTAPGNVTITDSVTTNTHFAPPSSTVPYGGIIGEYINSNYSNTLTLSGFTVNNLNCTSNKSVGGVIRVLNGATYVSVNGVSIKNVTANSASYFGGIVSTLDNNNAGSFIDLTGDYTLSMASGKTYRGGAIAGSFKKGVIRFAGVTDISGAQAENGYAQLVYENDETLVYAKGSGSDENWTLKRNADTTASDLGQWGEVIRLFKVGNVYKNAEGAEIVSVSNNKVTVAQGVTGITDTVTFAKCALNTQLNDGADHGALCFADKTVYPKSVLLGSALTVSGTIDLSGTGLLGLMRDGGNGKYLDTSNTFQDVEFFTGSVTGSNNAEIKLATGELYGTYEDDATGTGGKIYVANNYGHDAQGLFAFAKGTSITNLKVSGKIDVERNAGSEFLYAGALFGAMTNGATLSGVDISTTISTTRAGDIRFYIGGVAGVYDGTETPETGSYDLVIEESSLIKPTINLYGVIGCEAGFDKKSTYVGGVLGLLKGSGATKYGVTISNSEVSPSIIIDNSVANTDLSYLGGVIGRVAKNANLRKISFDTVTMTKASVDTKSKHAGGLLGAMWETTDVTIDGLTISNSNVNHKYTSTGSHKSGLVFMGTGKWNINSLSISDTSFSSTDTASASFGLIVNQAYSGNDGLYINLKNSGYSLSNVTVPASSTNTNYYVDEIAADTCGGDDILAGGNGTGIVNINMNAGSGTNTKITDTGTYQNRLYAQLEKNGDGAVHLIGNKNSRYYYNLDVMLAKGEASGGEKFLLWSVREYAAGNIKGYFKANDDMISDVTIDLSGLSYYPISGGEVTLPEGATVTFGFNAINTYENTTRTPDGYARNPDDTGAPNTTDARNQHYLMQTGLFTTVSSLTANTLTLAGDFGYVAGVASGALINGSTSGNVSLTTLTLDGLRPSDTNSYLLINYINGTGTATPSLAVSTLRATSYSSGLPVAESLFGKAQGQNMTVTFSDIKLDARDGNTPTGAGWDSTAASNMDMAYGTSRSIFGTATFFTELLSAKTSNLVYNYAVEADWNTSSGPRNVTYGKEITASLEYSGGEKRYYLVGETDGNYTNPVSNSNTEFDFSTGFLPYVANYENKGADATYPVVEIAVNYKAPGITVGCGTYNDPYVITTPAQLETIADIINNGTAPSKIRLPNVNNGDQTATTWHGENGDSVYTKNTSNDNYTNTVGTDNYGWNLKRIRYYLASAYYRIDSNLVLSDGFEGLGKPATANWQSVQTKGSFTFHGVIVGNSTSKPTITISNGNPLIVVANGAVVKNININVTTDTITKTQDETGDMALYGYGISHSNTKKENAVYYGGVIGEIMGGDNIIDDVSVTYTGETTLSGNYKHLIAEGGMVGAVVNGALIFRGLNTVSGRNVTDGGIYSNQYVGRVINGYAVYESITGRNGTAPDNYNKLTREGDKVTKSYIYQIDTIDRSKTTNSANLLDVNYSAGTITVPDAQSLYILSLITQTIASTADISDGNEKYGAYSPSYGYYNYITGVARLGDYGDVGCIASTTIPDDYSKYAYRDSVNNYYSASSKTDLLNAPIPYIIYRYTKAYESETDTIPSKNYPARKMTSDNTKFWDITLSSSDTFASFDSFQSFRGIGSVGINAYSLYGTVNASKTAFKVATFDGGDNTLNVHISLPRYERDKENYFHAQNKSLTQAYSGDELTSPYGHDENLVKLMGLGLFDCVMVSYDSDHEYQFKNFRLKGTIEDKVYNTDGDDITGTTDLTQLFCVGGVVGKRVNGNNSNINFNKIIFDGLTITGAYSCGGLIGIDAIGKNGKTGDANAKKMMKIVGCNSTTNGIGITGGYFGGDANIRHGIGSFVGMTFWCRPYIDGKTSTSDASNISVSKVTTFYEGDKGCSVGGLIGYTGSGAEIKNINLVSANSDAVIGGEKASNAAGFIGFTQAMTSETNTRSTPNANDLKDCVYIENCTIQNLPIKAKNGAGGFVAKTGNNDSWHTKYIYISDCAVVGDADDKPEIKAYGTGANTKTNCVGGFVGDLRSSVVTCLIQNSYIENYIIEGWHVGGIIGETTYRSVNLRNLYVKDCDIIRNNNSSGAIGGIVGYSDQNINGYNLKIDNVIFKKKTSNSEYTESPSDAGFILGESNGTKQNRFVGICVYNTTDSKIPENVIKTSGSNTGNFFVWADYQNTSASDAKTTSKRSTFNVVDTATGTQIATVEQPVAPFLTVNPRSGMGTNEYITGDGASIGKAGAIYAAAKAGTSKRKYTIGTVTDASFGSTDELTLKNYILDTGAYKYGAFRISTASAEFGSDLPSDVDFAMLVINDDAAKTNDITPFIKSYIRLVTNAAGQPNTNTFTNKYAYSVTDNNAICDLYQVVIRPCYYNGEKFVLGTEGAQGLQCTNTGIYTFDSSKADSESNNLCQFSLIDVQFKDPTDSTKIAYHLYVPVYTQKMLTAKFSAVSLSETKYYRSPYVSRINSEIEAGRSSSNPSQLVESTNEWTTTFIRYTYPKNQISSEADWNFDKSISITLDSNFNELPDGTKLILLDPNANVDKFYTLDLDGTWPKGTPITLNLSEFKNTSEASFTPQSLGSFYNNPSANGREGGKEVLYEDYYISMYVPKVQGHTHSIKVSSGTAMSHTSGTEVYKANIESKLDSLVVLGDLFEHEIVKDSSLVPLFTVESGDGTTWGDNPEMTDTNSVLRTDVTARVRIKDQSAGGYLANSNVYHSFFISLTSHYEDQSVSDIIYGITPGYITNTTSYSYTDSSGITHSDTIENNSSLGANYIELDTGSIIGAIYDPLSRPELTIQAVTYMKFNDVTAFPYNVSAATDNGIGAQVSIKSSLAYRPEDLRFSALNVFEEDPQGTFYFSTTKNNAELSFNAVPTDDETDEIGYKTNNRSLLGVNGKYGTSHPVIGRSLYNVDDVVDYESATDVQYTIELYKKVTDGAVTHYEKVNDISQYMTNVNMVDTKVTLTADITDPSMYVYTGKIDHSNPRDNEKMFEATFSCDVLTGDETHNEYANYKIQLTAQLIGSSNSRKDAYLIYTNAKFDPSVIDDISNSGSGG